jgi:hypothetical protein
MSRETAILEFFSGHTLSTFMGVDWLAGLQRELQLLLNGVCVPPTAAQSPRASVDSSACADAADARAAQDAPESTGVATDGSLVLLELPLELLLVAVMPKLELADIIACASTCSHLRLEIDGCASLWATLRAGCGSRQAFQRAYLSSCAKCHAPEAGEYSFEHTQGLCASCAHRMPVGALREFLITRRRIDWRVGAAERASTRALLRGLLRSAAEQMRRQALTSFAERPLRLAFSSRRDGHSLTVMQNALGRYAPCLVVVAEQVDATRDATPYATLDAKPVAGAGATQAAATAGVDATAAARTGSAARRFGVFVPVKMLRRSAPDFKSDEGGGSFLFALPSRRAAGARGRAAEPATPRIFPGRAAEGAAGVRQFYRTSSEHVAFGGDERAYALWLSASLERGLSLPCPTFGSPTLSSAPAFRVDEVQVWRTVDVEEELLEWQSAQAERRPVRPLDEDEEPRADLADSVLAPGTNRFMLEFVNMREDLLMERRAQ